jgi:hypothetical protein
VTMNYGNTVAAGESARATAKAYADARRALRNFAAVVRRAEKGELTGRNSEATHGCACGNFRKALTALVAIEDAAGVEPVLGDRLTALRQRATDCGLMSYGDVARIETEVCA